MIAIIPAAGYATRLYPLTLNQPKHLLEVKGKPIIEHVVKKIEELEAKKIFIVSNEKYHKNFSGWAKSLSPKTPLVLLNDHTTSNEDRLGQVGDIQFAIEKGKINSDLLIVAGDNLFNFSLKPCHDFFLQKKKPVNALWDSKSIEVAKQQGIGVIDKNAKFVDFQEKPENPKTTLTSLGIYFLPKKHVKLFRQYISEGNNADKMGYFMIWLINNHEVFGYTYSEKWFDIGWHASLEQARKEFDG